MLSGVAFVVPALSLSGRQLCRSFLSFVRWMFCVGVRLLAAPIDCQWLDGMASTAEESVAPLAAPYTAAVVSRQVRSPRGHRQRQAPQSRSSSAVLLRSPLMRTDALLISHHRAAWWWWRGCLRLRPARSGSVAHPLPNASLLLSYMAWLDGVAARCLAALGGSSACLNPLQSHQPSLCGNKQWEPVQSLLIGQRMASLRPTAVSLNGWVPSEVWEDLANIIAVGFEQAMGCWHLMGWCLHLEATRTRRWCVVYNWL